MSDAGWVTVPVPNVRPGDRLRLRSGTEMTVTRVERPFLGQDALVCFVEDSPSRWLAQPMPAGGEAQVQRP